MSEADHVREDPADRLPDHSWLAVRPAPGALERGVDFGRVPEPEELEFPKATRDALALGGWTLVEPTRRVSDALGAGRRPVGAMDALWAYPTRGGDLVLASWRCTVRLHGDERRSASGLPARARGRSVRVLRRYPWRENTWSVRIPRDEDPQVFAAAIREEHPEVVAEAEPEWLVALEHRYEPRGPLYRYQWQWRNRGGGGAIAGADVSAEKAWALSRGRGARIAVIDSGFDPDQTDIAGKALPISGYYSGTGTPPFQAGVGSLPSTPSLALHGTMCTAMAAARPRRRRGLTGMAPRARLILVAVDITTSVEMLASAIAHAVNPHDEIPDASPLAGADVVSSSVAPVWSAVTASERAKLVSAVAYAESNGRAGLGTPVTWAVPNVAGVLVDDAIAGVNTVLSVGMTKYDDTSGGHDIGPKLDLVAPGYSVLTAKPAAGGVDWIKQTGSSLAAPLVGGIVALMLSANPTLTAAEIREHLFDSCEQVGGVAYPNGRNDNYGHGRVDAHEAVKRALYPPPPP